MTDSPVAGNDRVSGSPAGGWVDAAARSRRGRSDPTGTTAIRVAFRLAAERNLIRWRHLVRVALLSHDVFGHSRLRAGEPLAVEHIQAPSPRQYAWLDPADQLTAFGQWLDQSWAAAMVQNNWWDGYLRNVLGHGLREAEADTRPTGQNYGKVTALLTAQIRHEVEGIGAAALQTVKRLAGDQVHKKTTPLQAYREITKAIAKVAMPRLNAMVNTYTTKAYNRIKLAVYRNAGVTQVGIIPERILVRSTLDALFDAPPRTGPGSRASRERTPSASTIGRIERTQRRLQRTFGGAEVAVQTMGDDRVCPLCEDIAAEGPYDLDTAEGLIPAHAHCRCSFVLAD